MRRILLLVIGVIVLVFIGWATFRVYPRHISLSIRGIEYKLGSPQQEVHPVTLQLNGTLQTSLLGKRTFNGKVNILGSTVPNKDNAQSLKMVFNSELEAEIIYFDWNTQQFYQYGELYANRSFNEFTITVFQHEGKGFGWSGADGLMISAPAQTRAQALQISNNLMKARLLPGHPLE